MSLQLSEYVLMAPGDKLLYTKANSSAVYYVVGKAWMSRLRGDQAAVPAAYFLYRSLDLLAQHDGRAFTMPYDDSVTGYWTLLPDD